MQEMGKWHPWLIVLCSLVVGLPMAFGVPSAQAQIRYLPAAEYDRVNIHAPQAIVSRFSALSQQNVFERLARFKAGDRYRRAGRPVGRLKILVRDSRGRKGTAMCTVSIVSTEYLLTNNHCIPGEIGLKVLGAKAEFAYLDAKDSGEVRSYGVDIRPVETSEELDYSILRVHGNPAAVFGTVTFAAQPAEVRDSIFIIGYPEGQPETLSRKDCYVRAIKTEEFTHSCDTLPGSSGSPVFSDETFRMIGLHYAGGEEGNFAKNARELLAYSRLLESVAVVARPGAAPTARPPARPTLTIALGSEPSGAAVFYDKTLLGVTPLSFAMAPRGQYTFHLRKAGYAESTLSVAGRPGTVERTVRLERAAVASAATKGGTSAPDGDWSHGLMPDGRFDPAAVQARKALAFWQQMEESGQKTTSRDQSKAPVGNASPTQANIPAAEQVQKANDFWKSVHEPNSKSAEPMPTPQRRNP